MIHSVRLMDRITHADQPVVLPELHVVPVVKARHRHPGNRVPAVRVDRHHHAQEEPYSIDEWV